MVIPTAVQPETVPPVRVRAFWRWAVFGLAVFAVLFQLGTRGLNEPDEGRYAEIGREMAVSGDWLVPHWNGIEHYSKPPMTYWLIAASLKLFGVNEFAARLPAAVAALGTLAAVYLLARRAWNERAALWAVLVLLTSLEFFAAARLITTDMILTCFVTWSVWLFWSWHMSADKRWNRIVWFYVVLGLAMMTKGPVGVVLPLFAVLAVRWRHPHFRLRQMMWGRGAIIFLIITLPWFVTLAWRDPRLWHYFIVHELFERVATNEFRRDKTWWYFLPVMTLGMLPWTPLWLALRRLRGGEPRQKDFVRLCAGWAGLGLMLFTLSHSKLPTYVLPLYAPLALLLGAVLAQITDRGNNALASNRSWYVPALLVTEVVCVALTAGGVHARYGLPWTAAIQPLALAIAGAIGCAMLLWSGRRVIAAGVFAVMTLAVMHTGLATIRRIERSLSHQTTAKFVGERIRREDPANAAPVVVCDTFVCGLPFYLERFVLLHHDPVAGRKQEEEPMFNFRKGVPSGPSFVTEQQFQQLLAGPGRVFCVMTARQSDQLQATSIQKLYPLEQAGHWVLLSNRPASS